MSEKTRIPKTKKHNRKSPPAHEELAAPINPAQLARSDVLQLQRLIGNSRVSQLLHARNNAIQRDDPVNMDPMRVSGDRGGSLENNASNLDQLRGQGRNPNEPELGRDDATVNQNSPLPTQRLPFTANGWDGNEIMTRLGQYDRLAGTDSDTKRCVQAVAMASRIPSGPDSVRSYLGSAVFDGLLSRQINSRQHTAMEVIKLVKERLQARTATYGDLSWAQEAIHDLYYNDVSGTPEDEIAAQINPTLEGMSRDVTPLNVWCNTPGEVMAQANVLPAGGQLVVNTWTVVLNSAYDDLAEQGVAAQDRMQVRVNNRVVWIRRIPTDRRPRPQDIDINRDSKSGHQLLVLRDNVANGPLRLYEPEVTTSGQHLQALSQNGQEMTTYLTDDTQNGIYGYIQITGKIIPRSTVSPFGGL